MSGHGRWCCWISDDAALEKIRSLLGSAMQSVEGEGTSR